jgi:hypothetical protein
MHISSLTRDHKFLDYNVNNQIVLNSLRERSEEIFDNDYLIKIEYSDND